MESTKLKRRRYREGKIDRRHVEAAPVQSWGGKGRHDRGKLVYQTTKKRASGPKCPVTGKRIQGERGLNLLGAFPSSSYSQMEVQDIVFDCKRKGGNTRKSLPHSEWSQTVIYEPLICISVKLETSR
ncbi:hypothetical protein NL676_027272 [Syzygium grande]|nr:hypothetical protein NL676_027272 [Syzygium grande]